MPSVYRVSNVSCLQQVLGQERDRESIVRSSYPSVDKNEGINIEQTLMFLPAQSPNHPPHYRNHDDNNFSHHLTVQSSDTAISPSHSSSLHHHPPTTVTTVMNTPISFQQFLSSTDPARSIAMATFHPCICSSTPRNDSQNTYHNVPVICLSLFSRMINVV